MDIASILDRLNITILDRKKLVLSTEQKMLDVSDI